MSWLRGRRRTLDIVNEVSEFDVKNNVDSLNTGVYNSSYDGARTGKNKNETSCENCEQPHPVDTECVRTREENNNDFKNDNVDGVDDDDSVFEDDNENIVDNSVLGEEHRINDDVLGNDDISIENGDDVDGVVSSDDILIETNDDDTIDHPDDIKVGIDEEKEADESIENYFKKSGSSKPRYSLDSQMAGLLKSPNASRMTRLSESAISEDEVDNVTLPPRPRKSISWAEDLESVHEFEKLKPRRLSLANLFKKI